MTVNMMSILGFKSDASTSQSQDEGSLSFYHDVKREYSQFDQASIFDMATGGNFPHEHVVVTPIFQPSWRKFLPLLTSSKNINDAPNGLILYKPVAWAFSWGKLCIEVDRVGRMSFHLFDDDLRYVSMASKTKTTPRSADEVTRELDFTFGDFDPTFGDLDGKEVQFPEGSMMRPSKPLLALHAYASWLKAWSLQPNIEFPIPQHIFSDNEGKGTDGANLGYSIKQWILTVHASLPVSHSCQSP